MKRPNLSAEMVDASRSLSLLHLKRLEALGVPWSYVCDLSGEGALGVLLAKEGEDETFYPHADGLPHLILPVVENGALVDLLAFRSSDPGRWFLRCGLGTALGLEGGLEPFAWLLPHEAVPVHKTPLDWLKAGRVGLCVVDWSTPDLGQLCSIPHLACSDDLLAAWLTAALTRPTHLPKISTQEALAHAA